MKKLLLSILKIIKLQYQSTYCPRYTLKVVQLIRCSNFCGFLGAPHFAPLIKKQGRSNLKLVTLCRNRANFPVAQPPMAT